MRIAFIVGRFPALSQTFILRQVTGLLERGHEVEIFAQRPGEEPVGHRDVETFELMKRTRYLNIFRVPAEQTRRVRATSPSSARESSSKPHRRVEVAQRHQVSQERIDPGRPPLCCAVFRSRTL